MVVKKESHISSEERRELRSSSNEMSESDHPCESSTIPGSDWKDPFEIIDILCWRSSARNSEAIASFLALLEAWGTNEGTRGSSSHPSDSLVISICTKFKANGEGVLHSRRESSGEGGNIS